MLKVVSHAQISPQIGRPREFDHYAVVDVAVQLFWEQGFAATSISDVVERTGLSKSSLYGTFGSKEALFRTALDRYLEDHRVMIETILVNGSGGLSDIDAFLDRIKDQVEQVEERLGCLAVNTSTELGVTEPSLVEYGTRHRELIRTGFTAALERAVAAGEIPQAGVGDTANVLVSTVLGLAVMIRGGADGREVQMHIDSTRATLRSG